MASKRSGSSRRNQQQNNEPNSAPGEGGTGVDASGEDWREIAGNPEVRSAIKGHFAYKDTKAAARSKINADINSSRKGLEGRSLNPHAVKAMEQFFQMDAGKRAGWLQSVLIILDTMGAPIQRDMLAGLITPEATAPPDGAGLADKESESDTLNSPPQADKEASAGASAPH